MLKQTLNKGISTPIAIGIILILVILVGGFTWWQYSEIRKEETELPELEIPEKIDIKNYLHKDVILHGVEMPPEAEYEAISLEKAILCAVEHSENKGVEDIKIHHVLWSVAPVGEFYIAGECSFSREDKNYSRFLANIRDGSEGEVGEPKLLFKGANIWYSDPEPEIIYEPDPELPRYEQPDDEFLARYENIAEFYNISSVFRIIEVNEAADLEENQLKLYSWEIEELKKKGLQDPINDLRSDLLKHPELIPYKGIQGGTMIYYENKIWVLTKKWVLAYFEDGHILGYMLLEYMVSDDGEISWKVIESYLD